MFSYFLGKVYIFRKKEVDYGVSFSAKGVYKFIGRIFICIALYNFFAIFPHIFSVTSHILVTFPLSYTF